MQYSDGVKIVERMDERFSGFRLVKFKVDYVTNLNKKHLSNRSLIFTVTILHTSTLREMFLGHDTSSLFFMATLYPMMHKSLFIYLQIFIECNGMYYLKKWIIQYEITSYMSIVF